MHHRGITRTYVRAQVQRIFVQRWCPCKFWIVTNHPGQLFFFSLKKERVVLSVVYFLPCLAFLPRYQVVETWSLSRVVETWSQTPGRLPCMHASESTQLKVSSRLSHEIFSYDNVENNQRPIIFNSGMKKACNYNIILTKLWLVSVDTGQTVYEAIYTGGEKRDGRAWKAEQAVTSSI